MELFCRSLLVWLSLTACGLATNRPNVLLLIGDDQAWTDYGYMGHPVIQTPRLDALAAESVVFPRAYVPTSLCRPSLATLITGQYPHQHRISGNDPAFTTVPGQPKAQSPEYLALNQRLIAHIDAIPTLPRLLESVGYQSLQTGKWWEGDFRRGGFTHGMTHGDLARGGRHGDDGLVIGREGLQPVFKFIAAAGDDPWFIWYAPFLPHSPHNPPDRLLAKYLADGKSPHVARYQAMCEWHDEVCGQLLDHLDERGLADNTLVIYTCDNGWIQDENSPQFAPRSKRSPYDGGIRSPMILRWPGKLAPARYDTLVSTIDIAPTILAAAGIPRPPEMPGLDLLTVGRAEGATERDCLFGEIFDHDVADVEVPAASLQYRWCVAGDWKLIVPAAASAPAELYHITDDPHETHNLASEHAARVDELTTRINDWWNPVVP
jgi:arylsulfatase A-like enzyme